MTASRYGPIASVDRSLVNRSVAKAMRVPSGDHAGCISAIGVVRQPAKAVRRQVVDEEIGQSSLHAGERDGLSIGRPRRVQDLVDIRHGDLPGAMPLCASKMASAARPDITVPTAICRLALSHAPAE